MTPETDRNLVLAACDALDSLQWNPRNLEELKNPAFFHLGTCHFAWHVNVHFDARNSDSMLLRGFLYTGSTLERNPTATRFSSVELPVKGFDRIWSVGTKCRHPIEYSRRNVTLTDLFQIAKLKMLEWIALNTEDGSVSTDLIQNVSRNVLSQLDIQNGSGDAKINLDDMTIHGWLRSRDLDTNHWTQEVGLSVIRDEQLPDPHKFPDILWWRTWNGGVDDAPPHSPRFLAELCALKIVEATLITRLLDQVEQSS